MNPGNDDIEGNDKTYNYPSIITILEGRTSAKILTYFLIIYLLYGYTKLLISFSALVLVLALLIPERISLADKTWKEISLRIPQSTHLSNRFNSSIQSFRDAWKGFRRSLLSVMGLLMVVSVIVLSLYADVIAAQHQEESLAGQEKWPIYMDDPENGEPLVLYAYKKLPPFSGPKLDSITSRPSDSDQMIVLATQNFMRDNDGDLIENLYDNDDDNDGIIDFMDFLHPFDYDEDWTINCDENIWYDNVSGMYCGPDGEDLDDDGDGLLDTEEVSDDNPNTDIYDPDNDGIQDGPSSANGETVHLRVHHDTGADPNTVGIQVFSIETPTSDNGTWSCQRCTLGSANGDFGIFSIDKQTGEWKYDFEDTSNVSDNSSEEWYENFSLEFTNTSGQMTNFYVDLSIKQLSDAPFQPPNVITSKPVKDSDDWYEISVPNGAEMAANLSTESGSDYNLYLYGSDKQVIDKSVKDNGCPDFYSYDLEILGIEVISDKLCPFGTTHTGSDMLSKILYGSRKSLRIGFTVALVTCFLGLVIGGISGYFGGRIDEIIMRIADVFFAVPGLILAMAVVAAMSDINEITIPILDETILLDRLEKIMIALIFTGWPGYSRLIRGQVLSVKEHTYVEAAKSVGSNSYRILFKHVLPNAWAPMIVAVSLDVGGTILTASGLSFIGLGAEANSAEWGKMISDGRSYFPADWWMVTFPGLAILVTTLGFNLLGDGLRDVLDPKQRRSKS